jgi:UTP--glucose-1-phosphate uridylyltransferase
MKVKKAVIPAAGLATRLLPATKAQPKEMLPIVDKPTIQYIVEEAIQSGVEDILIVTGRWKRAIEDHFDKSYELEEELKKKGNNELLKMVQDISNLVNIHYIRQKEPKGLGHAIYCTKAFIGNEPFAVLLGDDIIDSDIPCLKQMIEVYDKYRTTILGVQSVPDKEVSNYGIVDCVKVDESVYKVKSLVEKPPVGKSPSNIAILGRYIITPRIFEFLENAQPGIGGEIQLTDALNKLADVEPMYAYSFRGKRYDVGNKMGYLKAMVEFALKRDDLKYEFSSYLKEIVKSL